MRPANKMIYDRNRQMRARRNVLLKYLFWFLLISALVLLFYKCPFKMITGTDCPGCGLTRAFACIWLCDIPAAVKYHPLSPLIFTELFYLVYSQFILGVKISRKGVLAGVFITALLMLVFWVFKII